MGVVEKTEQLNIRLTPAARQACESAATLAHMTLLDWARAVLVVAANQGAFGPRKERMNRRHRTEQKTRSGVRKGV